MIPQPKFIENQGFRKPKNRKQSWAKLKMKTLRDDLA